MFWEINLISRPVNNLSGEFRTFVIIVIVGVVVVVVVYNANFAMISIVITIITVPVTIIIVVMLVILVFIVVVVALIITGTINFIKSSFLSTTLSAILPISFTKSGQKDFNVRGVI